MTRRLGVWCGLALAINGCRCGQNLQTLGPNLVIAEPTAKVGTQWVQDFGGTQVGVTYSAPIVIQNHGQVSADVTSATLRTGSDPAFTLSTGTLPHSVVASGALSLTVTYAPTTTGSATGFVDLATTDPKLATATVKLTANAQASTVQVCVQQAGADAGWTCNTPGQPLVADFGTVLLNTAQVTKNVEVRNVGSVALTYFGAPFAAGSSPLFSMAPAQGLGAGLSLAPGGKAAFAALFSPTAPGSAAATATVQTSDPSTPSVPLQLQAVVAVSAQCHIDVAPNPVAFGAIATGTPADQTVVVIDDGEQPCTVTGLTLSGSPAFTLPGAPTVPLTLQPNGVATLDVHYAPTGTGGDTGTLTVASSDPVTPSLAVPLTGTGTAAPACVIVPTPAALDFGSLTPGNSSILSASLTLDPASTDLCTVTSATIQNGDPAFTATATYPIIIFPTGGVNPFGIPSIAVTYAPLTPRRDVDTLKITYIAGVGGPTLNAFVPLKGSCGNRQLCVVPSHLHFGPVLAGQTGTQSFTMTACGTSPVNVTSLAVEPAGTPFALGSPVQAPTTLALGTSEAQAVNVTPTSSTPASAKVHITSNDPAFPDQYVTLDVGPELVPPDAGEILYSWSAGTFTLTGAMDGSIFATLLQGPPNKKPFYGAQAGEACAGCHAVSPDGKYVALIEYSTSPIMRIVDAATGGALPIAGTANGTFPSWNPRTNTTPPYQFVYQDGNILKLASVSTGVMGPLAGADDPNFVQTQPSWGPNGMIAFVRGTPDADAGTFGVAGPADLMLIPQDGGTPTPVLGASGNAGDNYYPEFSPNGKYIAYTFSPSGLTTRSASDSVIKLIEVATGNILNLPQLNAAGPNSWPTWSKDGMFLSFSSTRAGGMGNADVYFAPVNQNTGGDGPATNLAIVNSINFDHIARWAPLPP